MIMNGDTGMKRAEMVLAYAEVLTRYLSGGRAS